MMMVSRSTIARDIDMTEQTIANLKELCGKENQLYNGDFLRTWDHELDSLTNLLTLAGALRELHCEGRTPELFSHGLAVSIFRDHSTRTRFSYASAASLLGLTVQELDETKTQVAHGETVRETANMISFLTQVIGIRDDMYIHEGHSYMKEVAASLDEGFAEGVLPQRPTVVNLQCDQDHPTQSMADLAHLIQTFGGLDNLRGKRLAMSWAHSPSYGKPLSVPQGIIGLMTRLGMDVVLAHPEGYDLLPDIVGLSEKQAAESGGKFSITHDMGEAFDGAHIVYPKSWAPFTVMEERTKLLRSGASKDDLHALEQRCLEQNSQHKDWECTADMMARTAGGEALYMHCLPADITGVSCEAGEVTAEVFEKYRLPTYHEASHKPFIIGAMMLMARAKDPAGALL